MSVEESPDKQLLSFRIYEQLGYQVLKAGQPATELCLGDQITVEDLGWSFRVTQLDPSGRTGMAENDATLACLQHGLNLDFGVVCWWATTFANRRALERADFS